MTYPLSSDVTDGQPTAYQHYNNLRADALRLGQATTEAVTLGAGLARYADNLVLEPLATNRLRVPYNALKPCTLMIDGYLCQATAHVDLSAGTFAGVAATWYLFANRAAGSATFTLSANTSLTEAAGQRRIAAINWDGANLVYPSLWVYPGGRPGVYYARVQRAAAQSINTTTWTTISYDTEDADTDGLWAAGSPTQVVIQHAGLYVIDAALSFGSTNTNLVGAILINGSAAALLSAVGSNAAGITYNGTHVSAIKYLLAGDVITVQIYQASGGALNTGAPTTLTVAALAA